MHVLRLRIMEIIVLRGTWGCRPVREPRAHGTFDPILCSTPRVQDGSSGEGLDACAVARAIPVSLVQDPCDSSWLARGGERLH